MNYALTKGTWNLLEKSFVQNFYSKVFWPTFWILLKVSLNHLLELTYHWKTIWLQVNKQDITKLNSCSKYFLNYTILLIIHLGFRFLLILWSQFNCLKAIFRLGVKFQCWIKFLLEIKRDRFHISTSSLVINYFRSIFKMFILWF